MMRGAGTISVQGSMVQGVLGQPVIVEKMLFLL